MKKQLDDYNKLPKVPPYFGHPQHWTYMNTALALQIMNKIAAVRRSTDLNDTQKDWMLTALRAELDQATGQNSLEGVKAPQTQAKAPK